jgi:hypothetical protein
MRLFFKHFNAKKPKKICPSFLKAPGGQYFYWGLLSAFQGQEDVHKVVVKYREEFFDGHTFRIVYERSLKELEIDS